MMLSDILVKFSDDASATEFLLKHGDLALLTQLRRLAAAADETLGEFAGNAVKRYASEASDDEWLTLVALVTRADDPAVACLRRALVRTAAVGA